MATLIRKKGKGASLPGGSVVENPPANTGDVGAIPGLGRSLHVSGQLRPCATTTELVL